MQSTDAPRWRPANRIALISLGLALVAAAPASAQVVEGQRADPAGDQVITPSGAPSGMDLTGASVRYDSSAGELRITYRGTITIASHSRTTYDGVVSQASSPGAGCRVAVAGDATFSGSTFDSSGGGDPRGTGRLEVTGVGPLDGVVLLPADGSVVFVFSSPLLRNLSYRCASALHARWMDATPFTSDDDVAPFDLPALPDAGVGATAPGAAGATSADEAAVATGGRAVAAVSPPPPRTVVVSRSLTARVVAPRGGLRELLGRGLTIPVWFSSGCAVRARVTTGGTVVARGSVARLHGGRATLRLRVDPGVRWLLAHRESVPATIIVTISDADGTSRTLARRLLLR